MGSRRRVSSGDVFLAVFFSASLAILVAVYSQFGFTPWFLAILAGMFALGAVPAAIDEVGRRRRLREQKGPLPPRANFK